MFRIVEAGSNSADMSRNQVEVAGLSPGRDGMTTFLLFSSLLLAAQAVKDLSTCFKQCPFF